MQCTKCAYEKTRVVESTPKEKDNSVYRRRECLRCGLRFTTIEQLKPPREKKQ